MRKSRARVNTPLALGSGMPDVGKMLREYVRVHRIRQSGLSRVMSIRQNTLWKYWKRPSLQLSVLWQMSLALKYNFIADLADKLPADLPRANTPGVNERATIAELEKKLEDVTRERDLLKEIISKRM
jgi:hypothetical protein